MDCRTWNGESGFLELMFQCSINLPTRVQSMR